MLIAPHSIGLLDMMSRMEVGVQKGEWLKIVVIGQRYQLTEMPDGKYRKRTRQNVIDSDATLILNLGELDGGTLQTQQFAIQYGKPCLVVQLDNEVNELQVELVRDWLYRNMPHVLNVAGPRENKRPGVYRATLELLSALPKN